MKILLLLCAFCVSCCWAEGDVSSEPPRVVMQSVVLDPHSETANEEHKDYEVYKKLNSLMSKFLQGCYPQTTRYKREDGGYPGEEAFDDKTVEKLLDALEELKEDTERSQSEEKKDDDSKKGQIDQICKRGGSWHRKIEEPQSKRRKAEMDGFKRILKDNYDDLLTQDKDMEKRHKRPIYRKKDWKEELERRRMRESLSDSWPRLHDERMPEDLFLPMPYHHHQPSHHRSYPSDYLP